MVEKPYNLVKINIEYYFIFVLTFLLLAVGIIMVSTSSLAVGERYFNDPYWFVRRQIIWCVASFVLFIIFSRIDYHKYAKVSVLMIIFSIVLLSLVLVPYLSIEINGARRWLNFGFFSIQPSELVKVVSVLYISSVLNKRYRDIYKVRNLIFPPVVVLLLITLLIFLEPDLGTVVVLWITIFMVLFIGGVRFKHLVSLGAIWLFVTTGYLFMEDYRRERIFAFLNKTGEISESNFQATQSLIALGSGSVTGLGLGNSIQKYSYLPESHTDFIFAIIGEELGLVGTLFIVILFFLFTYFGIRVCMKARDYLGRVMAAGLTSVISVQALINISVAVGLLPVTGITLPFISFGGSSLATCMISAGILLNISKSPVVVSGKTGKEIENFGDVL